MSSSENVRIAILDDYPDTASRHFKHIPNIQVDSFPETLHPNHKDGLEALTKRLEPYQIVSTMRERTAFPAELIQNLPNLKLLLTTGLRNAALDLAAASKQGIVVAGTKGERPANPSSDHDFDLPPPAGHSAVNQHAWALLLSLCGRIPQDDRALKTSSTAWQNGVTVALAGKTLGLFGLGKLGTAMAKVGVLAFGMEVIAWSENLTQEKADAAAEKAGLEKGAFKAVGKEELLRNADVVSLHLVLSDRSRGVIGEKELALMKRSALLVNTSRGPLVDEEALVEVLKEGRIGGAALDVYDVEPLPQNSPWRKADDFKSTTVLSPHMGYVNSGTMNRQAIPLTFERERPSADIRTDGIKNKQKTWRDGSRARKCSIN
jgi:lactate dehydrogenase-like 2-hydroxyacid dehydrogenase